jgi:hypothetical protein
MSSENADLCAQNIENGFSFDGDEFLSHIIRGGETWVSFVNVETKEQTKQWMHTHSPRKPKKFKQTLSARKLMTAVFLGHERNTDGGIHATGDCSSVRSVL